MESKSIQPDFRVRECLPHRSPGEPLVVSGVTVVLEPKLDEFPLLLREKFGSRGVVVYPEVRQRGDDNRKQAFLFD